MCNVKAKVIPVITGATGTISKSLRQYLINKPGEHEKKKKHTHTHTHTLTHSHIGHCTHTGRTADVKFGIYISRAK